MKRKDIISCLISFGCCILLSCSKTDPQPSTYTPPPAITGKTYSANDIAAFKQLTFDATNNKIVKWPKHVSLYLVDTGYSTMIREIDAILREINLLLDTNLVLTRSSNRIGSDIQIHLTDRNTYIAAEPAVAPTLQNSDYTGMAHLQWNEQGIVYRGSVFVDMDKTGGDTLGQRYLIHHEMMHILGFYGHVTLPDTYTVLFNHTLFPYILDYTFFDKRMMLLLYNPSIHPGMSLGEFNETVKNL